MRVTLGLVLLLAACTAPPAFAPSLPPGNAIPQSSAAALLYVSDFENSVVDVYSVPSLKLVRKLKGFFQPQGECTNAAGDVWIVDTGYKQIEEYAPGATKPMTVLGDYLGYPASCAINPVNGDLAVTNEFADSGPAEVLIYAKASGTPQSYRDTAQQYDDFAAYDTQGNLYVDGETTKQAYVLARLPAGGKTLGSVKVSGATIHDPGVVLWNDNQLVLGDQRCRGGKTSCLYVAAVSGSTAQVKSTIALGNSCDVVQVALFDGDLYGGNGQCANRHSTVDSWSYSDGARKGAAGRLGAPIGAAITTATERL